MARPTIPFEESATHEVYQCYRDYVRQENDPDRVNDREGYYFFPNPHVFWEKILRPKLGYEMPWGSFQYHWQRLQIKRHPLTGEPYIVVDETTKAVTLPELNLIDRRELERLKRLAERASPAHIVEKVGLQNLP